MIRYRRRELLESVDYAAQYDTDPDKVEAFYGLPDEVRFCVNCVISNQRPNSTVEFQHTADSRKSTIKFDDHSVCDARIYPGKKNSNYDQKY